MLLEDSRQTRRKGKRKGIEKPVGSSPVLGRRATGRPDVKAFGEKKSKLTEAPAFLKSSSKFGARERKDIKSKIVHCRIRLAENEGALRRGVLSL